MLVVTESYAYFNGEFVPHSQAKVGIMTHALNYGTACFEGIRAYWDQDRFSMESHMKAVKARFNDLGL